MANGSLKGDPFHAHRCLGLAEQNFEEMVKLSLWRSCQRPIIVLVPSQTSAFHSYIYSELHMAINHAIHFVYHIPVVHALMCTGSTTTLKTLLNSVLLQNL